MKKIFLASLLLSALALTSCSYINIFSSSKEETSSSIETTSSKKPSEILPSTYENYAKNSVYVESTIPTSTERSKYLVLPVWFTDSSSLIREGETKESIHANIVTAYSGTVEETGWNSVKTFYETESLGKKKFDITVADWYDCGYPSRYVAGDQNNATIGEDTEAIIYRSINKYFENHPDDPRTSYDSDKDGYIDAVAVVYAIQNYKSEYFDFAQYYGDRPGTEYSNLWAYVFWFQNLDYKNIYSPGPNAYLWASYDFANVSNKNPSGYPVKVDAHAYIHETGHLFGLDDYYDYIVNDNHPAAGFSMQDHNIGGHDPFSIFALGWIDEENIKVPTETSTITLEPFNKNHQVILLSNNYEGSAFDEYLLLELYTPDGLNTLDANYSYQGKYTTGASIPGIRLWHVDARLAYKLGRGYDYDYSENQISNKIDTQYVYNILCRNNTWKPGEEADYFSPLYDRYNYKDYRLLELIRSGDLIKSRYKSTLENQDLFVEGNSFSMSEYSFWFKENGRLNSRKELGWSFTVDAVSSESATITVTKL